MRRLLIATHNKHKLREFRDVFAALPWELVSLDDAEVRLVVDETGQTFKENAVLKARGSGLATPLDTFSVRFAADGESASVDARTPAFLKSAYGVRMLPVPVGWHAALCAPVGCEVRMRTA